ncbi:MAG: 30S ribosomal protein S20 [Deltaproteobacteria bacterium]|nr:30S ribosomal protein S20 [Deltaproteobacteria bacterium]
MATHKDAMKRARQSEEQRIRNRAYRTRMRNQVKKIRDAIAAQDLATAEALLPQTVSILQRIASKGVIHPRNAARRIRRIAQAVQALKKQA